MWVVTFKGLQSALRSCSSNWLKNLKKSRSERVEQRVFWQEYQNLFIINQLDNHGQWLDVPLFLALSSIRSWLYSDRTFRDRPAKRRPERCDLKRVKSLKRSGLEKVEHRAMSSFFLESSKPLFAAFKTEIFGKGDISICGLHIIISSLTIYF